MKCHFIEQFTKPDKKFRFTRRASFPSLPPSSTTCLAIALARKPFAVDGANRIHQVDSWGPWASPCRAVASRLRAPAGPVGVDRIEQRHLGDVLRDVTVVTSSVVGTHVDGRIERGIQLLFDRFIFLPATATKSLNWSLISRAWPTSRTAAGSPCGRSG